MFFRDGRQLPWFKIGVGRRRTGKEREKVAVKLEALAGVCDAEAREQLVETLCESSEATFSSELLAAVCEILGVRNALMSFDYLQGGEHAGLASVTVPALVERGRRL